MILISHRGNLNGKVVERENSPEYIIESLSKGYDCEVDVWYIDGDFFLGHDLPLYKINQDFLENSKLWCHAKNLESLNIMIKNEKIHSFWHQEDDVTLTSKNYLWTYPGKDLFFNSICVLPELSNYSEFKCFGICSDYIERYNDKINYI